METANRSLTPILVRVALLALTFEGFMVSAARLWVATDSGWYIKLAAEVAERFDFSHEYFQFRPPGYPLLLAGIFRLCGRGSPSAILVVQHALVAGTAILSTLIAWTLRPQRSFAFLAGLFGACSLHLSGYANTILTEVPYAFALTLCVWLLLHYETGGGWRWLAGASAAAGACTLIRAIGQFMPVLCLAVVLHRLWRTRSGSPAWRHLRESDRPEPIPEETTEAQGYREEWCLCGSSSRVVGGVWAAVLPAAVLILPVMVHNYSLGGRFQLTCAGDMELYQRALAVEKLDSPSSVALRPVRDALEEAQQRGLAPQTVTLTDKFQVNAAYRAIHGVSMAEAAHVMGQAARDLLRENLNLVLRRGVRYTYRTLVMPDLYYRVVPGEQPSEMFDVAEAGAQIAQVAGPGVMEKYLPLNSNPTCTSPLRGRFTHWYREHIEKGRPVLGLLDSPYEEFVLLCAVGGLLSLVQRNRAVWMVPAMVVVYHVAGSASLIGVDPRYAVPVHPLLHVFGAFTLVCVGKVAGILRERRCPRHAHVPFFLR